MSDISLIPICRKTYDPGDHLTSWQRPGLIQPTSFTSQTWAYDDNGNWTSKTLDTITETRTHNAGFAIENG